MKRGDARELAVHLIYGRAFTGEEPEQVVSTRLDKEYYGKLAEENEVYAQRPDRFQLRYIDSVVTGVANREDELDDVIRQFSIGWDISRISKLARCILRLAIYEILYVDDVPTGVAVAEAVRIAKKYDGDDTGAFINGILGSFVRSRNTETEAPQEEAQLASSASTPAITPPLSPFLTVRGEKIAPAFCPSGRGSWVCVSPTRYLPISKACRSFPAGCFPIFRRTPSRRWASAPVPGRWRGAICPASWLATPTRSFCRTLWACRWRRFPTSRDTWPRHCGAQDGWI